MIYQWHIQPAPTSLDFHKIPDHLRSSISQHLYYQRFLGPNAIMDDKFAWPSLDDITDPKDMPELMEGAECLTHHLENGGSICIFSDYDVDGICGGVIMYLFLKEAYPNNHIQILQSDRFSEGYGLHVQHVERLADFSCVLTVDCGSSSIRATEQLVKAGCDVIITDHHECAHDQEGNVVRPHAKAFINPKRPDCPHYYSFLSGTGVALILCIAMRRFSQACRPIKLTPLLDLVCTSIISDSVPLINENRLIVQYGLKVFNQNPRPFFQELLNAQRRYGPVDATTLSFSLIPKLNAPGRLGKVDPIIQGLLSEDEEEIHACVKATLMQNQARMEVQQTSWELIQPLIVEQANSDVICIYHPQIHEGVMGILASRVSEMTHKPTLILSQSQNEGEIKGSGRAYGPQSIYDVVQNFTGYFKQFGGHQAAIGCTIPEANLDAFREKLASYKLPRQQPTLNIDGEINIQEINLQTAMEIQSIGPYGQSFPEPCFLLRSVSIPKLSMIKDQHLKGIYESADGKRIDFIAWKMGHTASQIHPQQRFDVVFQLKVNHYMNTPKVQCEMIDLEPTQS